ncbi:MAG: hypothetical protein P4L22_03190 [Candidatus Babeliales bacterium]|nr:hypothetical protein [Candidatus Babeliales bacterium]
MKKFIYLLLILIISITSQVFAGKGNWKIKFKIFGDPRPICTPLFNKYHNELPIKVCEPISDLDLAIRDGFIPGIKNLLESEIDIQQSLLYAICYLKDRLSDQIPNAQEILFLLLLYGADITLKNKYNEDFFYYLRRSLFSEVTEKFINYILATKNLDEIKGAENALLIAGYLNDVNLINALLRKGVWFKSEKNKLYFNNLIADKPAIHAVVNQYNHERNSLISTHLVPELANITSGYL